MPELDPRGFIKEFNRRRLIFKLIAFPWTVIGALLGTQLHLRHRLVFLGPFEQPLTWAFLILSAILLFVSLFVCHCPSCFRYIGSLDGGNLCDMESSHQDELDFPVQRSSWLRRRW